MTALREPGEVLIGIACAALGVYALVTGTAAFPFIAGLYSVRKQDHPGRYWLVVVALFLGSAISFLQAWGLIVI